MSIGINISIAAQRYGGLSQDAIDFEARVIANGGTIPTATLAIFDNVFFKPAKANGNILSELDRLNIYCGLVGYEIAARTNLIKSAHYVTPVSSPTFDNNGYKSSGTSYLDLNYTPSSQAVKLTQNSINFGAVVVAPQFESTVRTMGVLPSVGGRLELDREATPRLRGWVNNSSGTNVNTNVVTSGNVFLVGKRTSSTNAELIVNTNSVAFTQTSEALANQSMFELTVNSSGPLGGYDTLYHRASWCGSSALDYTNFYIILNNLFTALGV